MLSSIKNRFTADTLLALKNVNWIMIEKLVSVPVSLLLSIILARHLGTETFGQYNYFVALVMLIVPIAALGLHTLVTKEVLMTPDATPKIMGSSLFGRLAGCFCGVLILLAYAFFMDANNVMTIFFLAFCQIFSAFTVLNFWFQAKQLNKFAVIARLCALLLGTTLKITIVLNDLGLQYLIYAYGLDFLLVAFFLMRFYNLRNTAPELRTDFSYLPSLLARSKWLLLSSVAAAVNLKIDLVMLANMSDDVQLGLYSLAARISEVWYFIPIAVTNAFFPMLMKAKGKDQKDYHTKLQRLNDVLLGLSLAVLIPVILFSEFFIKLLFGNDFAGSAVMLNIHIFGGVFIFMRALLSKWLIAEDLLKFSLVTHLLGAIVNVVANWLLIPEMGGVGAAWASVLSYIMASYLALFTTKSTMPMAVVMTKSLFYPIRFLRLKA